MTGFAVDTVWTARAVVGVDCMRGAGVELLANVADERAAELARPSMRSTNDPPEVTEPLLVRMLDGIGVRAGTRPVE